MGGVCHKINLIQFMPSVVSWQGPRISHLSTLCFPQALVSAVFPEALVWRSMGAAVWCSIWTPPSQPLASWPGQRDREIWRLLCSSERSWWEEEKGEMQLRKAERALADPHSRHRTAVSWDVGSWLCKANSTKELEQIAAAGCLVSSMVGSSLTPGMSGFADHLPVPQPRSQCPETWAWKQHSTFPQKCWVNYFSLAWKKV